MGDIYVGVNGQPKKVIGVWVGVNGVPKKVKNAWVGVDNTPKVIYVGLGKAVVTSVSIDGMVYWEAASGAVRYKVKKYQNGTWVTSSVFTANTYYQLANYSSAVTKVAVIAYDARTSTANTTTSDDYIIPWIKITFNGNGGTPDESDKDIYSGSPIGTLPSATRTNYTFDYWRNGSTSGDRVYETTVFQNNSTLYAKWLANLGRPVVTGVDNDGTIHWLAADNASYYNAKRYRNGSWTISSTRTTNLYYKFAVFDTNVTMVGVRAYDSSGNYEDSEDYEINWITITFNGNGGTPSESSRSIIQYNAIGTLPTATRSGYDFDGWYFSTDTYASRVYPTTTFNASRSVYAHWSLITVGKAEIYQVDNDGTVYWYAATNASYYRVIKYQGSTWYTGAKTTNLQYTLASIGESVTKLKIRAYASESNYTDSDEYNITCITVTFDANGGETDEPKRNVVVDNELGTLPSATRFGCSFNNWWTSSGSYGNRVYPTAKYSSNMTVYAHWNILISIQSASKSTKTVTWNKPTGATKFVVFKSGNQAGTSRDRSIIYANNGHKLSGSETIDTYTGTFLTGTSYTFGYESYMYEVCVVAYDDDGNHIASNWYTAT